MARLFISPQQQKHRHFVVGLLHVVQVGVRAIRLNQTPRLNAVCFCLALRVANDLPLGNQDIRLILNKSVIGVSEKDLCVFQNLRDDLPLGLLARLCVRVPIGVSTTIPIHSGVSRVLSHEGRDVQMLGQAVKFLIDNADRCRKFFRGRGSRQRGRIDLDVVRRDRGHCEQCHALEDVEHRGRQAV